MSSVMDAKRVTILSRLLTALGLHVPSTHRAGTVQMLWAMWGGGGN